MQYFYANVYVGSNRQPQSLIIDTGSGIAAFPCDNYCESCGKHINEYFGLDLSTSKHIPSCKKESCECFDGNKCSFHQGYGEGSSYSGFITTDKVHFGEAYHAELDAFNFTFGCVTKETHLFYT